MAITAASIKAEILLQMAAQFGASEDAAKTQKFAQGMADALITILESQMVVTVTVPGGSSAGTYIGVVT